VEVITTIVSSKEPLLDKAQRPRWQDQPPTGINAGSRPSTGLGDLVLRQDAPEHPAEIRNPKFRLWDRPQR
jgi:hypothetical protein